MAQSKFLLATLLGISLGTAALANDFQVKFDCYFRAGPVSCTDVHDSYFSAFPYLKETLDNNVDTNLSVQLRSAPGDRETLYQIEFKGRDGNPIPIPFSVKVTLTPAEAELEVLNHLTAGTILFLKILAPAQTASGVTTIQIGLPDGHSTGPSTEASTKGWYITVSGYASYNTGDTDTKYLSNSELINYSSPNWRFRTNFSTSYNDVKVTYGDQTEEQKTKSLDAKFLLARSLTHHWTVALIADYKRDPANNLASQTGEIAGIEWELVPFLQISDSHTMGVQYEIGEVHERYVSPNLLGESTTSYIQHSAVAFTTWHFNRLDLNGEASAASPIKDYRFFSAYGSGGFTVRVTDRLSFTGSTAVVYKNASINQPGDTNVTDALQKYLAGGNYAKVSTYNSLSLSFTLGRNQSLFSQDQRWP